MSATRKLTALGLTARSDGMGPALSRADSQEWSQAEIMGTVRVIGGAMIGIAVLVVVLNEVFSLPVLQDRDNTTFGGILDSLESTGGAALGLLVIGLLVLGANRVMGFFGKNF